MRTLLMLLFLSTNALALCQEDKIILHSEFIQTNIDAQRSTLGKDLVEPVKQKIQNFVATQTEVTVTDIVLTSSAAKLPFYVTVAGKKRIDPESDQRSFSLAQEKSVFAFEAVKELKKSNSTFEKVEIKTGAELSGPEFKMSDLNTRFFTHMSEGYDQKIKELYQENKEDYNKKAFINSADELKDQKKFVNLYQAKFRPFEGFRIQISGFKKCKTDKKPKSAPSQATKQ